MVRPATSVGAVFYVIPILSYAGGAACKTEGYGTMLAFLSAYSAMVNFSASMPWPVTAEMG